MVRKLLFIASAATALLAGTGAASADCWRYDGSGSGSQRQIQTWDCGYYQPYAYDGGYYSYGMAPGYEAYGAYDAAPGYNTYPYERYGTGGRAWSHRWAEPPGGVIQDRGYDENAVGRRW